MDEQLLKLAMLLRAHKNHWIKGVHARGKGVRSDVRAAAAIEVVQLSAINEKSDHPAICLEGHQATITMCAQ